MKQLKQQKRQKYRSKKVLKFKKSNVILVPMSETYGAKETKETKKTYGANKKTYEDKETSKMIEKRLKKYGNKLGTARFGFSTSDRRASDGGPDIYYVPVSVEPGQILLAQNAFSWIGDPLSRALAHSSG